MKTMWKITGWGNGIERVEVVKETASFVTYRECWNGRHSERRQAKRDFYNTFEEAKAAVMDGARAAIRQCQSNLDSAKSRLQKLNELKEPKP